jgi:co-chaperonin GroES (HSP10)
VQVKKSRIVPAGHRVLVTPDKAVAEEVRESGIVVPIQNHKEAQYSIQRATVVAVGPDAWKAYRMMDDKGREVNGRPWAKEGDRVWIARGAGRRVNLEEEDHIPEEQQTLLFLINDEDVCGRIEYLETEEV